jgi:hypothetical protein
MDAKAQPRTGGRKAGTPNKIQSALSIIRAEAFAGAVRPGHTALWHPGQYAAGLLLIDHITGMIITAWSSPHDRV